jgi:hypothetical protein
LSVTALLLVAVAASGSRSTSVAVSTVVAGIQLVTSGREGSLVESVTANVFGRSPRGMQCCAVIGLRFVSFRDLEPRGAREAPRLERNAQLPACV